MCFINPEDGGNSRDRRGPSEESACGRLIHLTNDAVAGVDGSAAGLRRARVAVSIEGGRLGGTKKRSVPSLEIVPVTGPR
jgi:hypothetical protein